MSSAKFLIPTVLVVAATLAARVFAIDDSVVTLQSLKGAGWQAAGIRARIEFGATLRAELSIERARLDASAEEFRNVRISCPDLRVTDEVFACARAKVQGVLPYVGSQSFIAAATYQRRSGALDLRANDVTIAHGVARVGLGVNAQNWQLDLDIRRVALAELMMLARNFGVAPAFSAAGTMDGHVEIGGHSNRPEQLRWDLTTQSLNMNNPAGTLASEALRAHSHGRAERDGLNWNFDLDIETNAGQGYAEPVFVDFGKHALAAKIQGRWTATALELRNFEVDQRELAKGRGRGTLMLGEKISVADLRLDIERLQFPGAYATYLQPFLLNTSFKALQTSGAVSGDVAVANNLPTAVNLKLQDLNASDGTPRLLLQNIAGAVHWSRGQKEPSDVPRSYIRWKTGTLLGLQLGETELQLEAWDTTLRLAEPARIPIFNGALALDALRIRKIGTPQMAFMLDANIEPLQVAQLCRAFGWPEFGGELSGRITKLRLEDGVLTLGTTLNAQVFAGQVAIGNMRLENAFGAWPRFQADISLQNLDLEQVTQAFSFGRITGRLSGEINQLNLFNWQPVAFDARLYTPENDRSRHRISQRAVQNIGSLGGSGAGVAAALQGGLLKFFEDFNYDRLGISCRLENEICRMNGIAPAGTGYYLVKGRGLPRIDVIGNAERVDWPRMVAQLKAATESSGPVVQ